MCTICSGIAMSSLRALQVAWIGTKERVTWENGSALPQSLIDEFERNELYEPDILGDSRFGVTSHTLIASKRAAAATPPNKKGKYTQPVTDPGLVSVHIERTVHLSIMLIQHI